MKFLLTLLEKAYSTRVLQNIAKGSFQTFNYLVYETKVEHLYRQKPFHFSGKPFDVSNLMNPSGKEFDQNHSSVLAMIQQNGSAAATAAGGGGGGPPRTLQHA